VEINPNYLVFAETPCGAVHVENMHPKIPQKVLDGSRRLTDHSCMPEVFIKNDLQAGSRSGAAGAKGLEVDTLLDLEEKIRTATSASEIAFSKSSSAAPRAIVSRLRESSCGLGIAWELEAELHGHL